MNKKQLAILLSQLKTFEKQDIDLEQHQTECEIAAEVLWFAFLNGDVKNKNIADLGCGNGIFGLGALILGAKKAIFLDVQKEILDLAKENLKFLQKQLKHKFKAEFLCQDVQNFKRKIDVVIQNPPFGVREKHRDKLFLIVAMDNTPVIYSFHKIESKDFIKKFTEENGFKVKSILKFNLPLKRTLRFHRKKVYYVKVGCWKIVKNRKI